MQKLSFILKNLLTLMVILLGATCLLGQNQQNQKVITLVHADRGLPLAGHPGAQKLMGNVELKYKEVIMTCDSAYRYPNGNFDAFSDVHINQADTLHLYGDKLFIESKTKLAKLRSNIRMVDREMTLTTDVLDYELDNEVASYYGGGTIRSKKNNNVLVSEEGYYIAQQKSMLFRNDVVLTNPDYKVVSDTLRYHTISEVAYFHGPTTIVSDDTEIYCENGWYNTKTEVCQFNKNAVINSGPNILKGDSIFYNGSKGYGEVFRNVSIRDTTSNFLILGDYGMHDEKTNESLVTKNAQLIQQFEQDSLFLHGDTLFSYQDSLRANVILAYHNVRFFKSDLQGICDSLSYSEGDSLLAMYHQPVLWSDENQISGKRIDITLKDGVIDRMFVDELGFIISEAVPERFNQIKGRTITGYFTDNKLTEMLVVGNGQTLYFPVEEKEGEEVPIGMFKQECSEIRILIDSNKIQKVTWIEQPSGGFHPNSLLSSDDMLLEGFNWSNYARPQSSEDIFRIPKVPNKQPELKSKLEEEEPLPGK